MTFERMVEFPVHDGDESYTIAIYEHELPTITSKDLKKLDISRRELRRLFAEAMKEMEAEGYTASDRVRPCADRFCRSARWEFVIVRYSELSDPLMQGSAAGSC